MIAGAAVLVAVGLAATGFFVFHPFGQHAPLRAAQAAASPALSQAPSTQPSAPTTPNAAAAPAPVPTTTPVPPAPVPTAQQAAQNLAVLLASSVNDRRSIDNAYSDAKACGPGLGQDARIFRTAARSRKQLLRQLADMPGQSALSGQMLADLTGAWQASATVDRDYAEWARDLVSVGCTGATHQTPASWRPAAPIPRQPPTRRPLSASGIRSPRSTA